MPARTRNTSHEVPTAAVYKDSYYPTGPNGMDTPYASTLFYGGSVEGKKKLIIDTVTPNYATRIGQGDIINNPLTLVVGDRYGSTNVSWDTGVVPSATGGIWGRLSIHGDIHGMVGAKSWTADTVYNGLPPIRALGDAALLKAYAKMKAPPTQGLVSLVELEETLKMFRSPFKSARKLLVSMLKQKRKRTLGKTLRDSARIIDDLWLEYQYGWRNVVFDVDNAIKSATEVRGRLEKQRRVVRGSESNTQKWECDFDQSGFGSWPTLRARGHVAHTIEQRGDAGIIFECPNSTSAEQLVKQYGLEARNLPAAVWEMIPYSFVVDWFVGVGDWLQAIVPDPSINVLATWVTEQTHDIKTQSNVTLSIDVTSLPALPTTTFSYQIDGSVTEVSDTVQRYTDRSCPPTPSVNLNIYSLMHTLNGLALGSQRILNGLKEVKRPFR